MSDTQAKPKKRGLLKTFILILILAAAGYQYMTYADGNQKKQAAKPAGSPPPPVAQVLVMKPRSVRTWADYSGKLSAVNIAEIKPQVAGEIQKVLFKDGEIVDKGALLFVIDPRPHEAAVKKAKAQLESANSRAKLAKDELERTKRLVKRKLISESAYDSAKNDYQVAIASINEAQSALVQAKLDLDYCYIRAPFRGRISRAELTVGNVVATSPNAPVLTTLVSNDKLYAEFNVDEQTYIKMVRGVPDPTKMPVTLTLAADKSVVYKGHIYAFDNQLDTNSGTIRARAIFDNVDGILTPGMFANVRLGSATEKSVLLVPQRAINTNQDKKFVYVVNSDNKATYREVALGNYHDNERVVVSGLKAGERVVVDGLSHIRPNSVVTPKVVDEQQVASE